MTVITLQSAKYHNGVYADPDGDRMVRLFMACPLHVSKHTQYRPNNGLWANVDSFENTSSVTYDKCDRAPSCSTVSDDCDDSVQV